MDYKTEESGLDGVKIILPQSAVDERGYFSETFSKEAFIDKLGISSDFIQDCESYSLHKYTLRGIHFQNEPYSQAKLVRCTRGSIIDVVVDLRKNSANYKKYVSFNLNSSEIKMIYIPMGFGHAFLTMEDNSAVNYKIAGRYSSEHSRTIAWNDSEINIKWPDVTPILSEKDRTAPFLSESDINY